MMLSAHVLKIKFILAITIAAHGPPAFANVELQAIYSRNLKGCDSMGWKTVEACVICDSIKKCRATDDGMLAWCKYVESKRQAGDGWIHFLKEDCDPSVLKTSYSPASRPFRARDEATKKVDTFPKYAKHAKAMFAELKSWADERSVTVESMALLGIYPVSGNRFLMIPERDPETGNVCGFVKRYPSTVAKENRFRFEPGSKRGFGYSDDLKKSPIKTLIIVEGFADGASAIDAGFAAVTRPSRNANLKPLAKLISDVPHDWPIFLLLENDEAKPGRKTPREEVESRAIELFEASGRTIFVASPPPEHKDFNDWWKSEVQFELNVEDRLRIGLRIREFLLDQVKPEIIERNQQVADRFKEDLQLRAEIVRSDREKDGIDLDYPIVHCGTSKIFTREVDDGTQFYGMKLACRRWSCLPCRERILQPSWAIRIAEGFQDQLQAFHCSIHASEYANLRKKLFRSGAVWVCIRTNDEESQPIFEAYSSKFIADGQAFDFSASAEIYLDFLQSVRSAIAGVDWSISRPISCSRGLSEDDRPTIEDWAKKIARIQPAAFVAKTDQKQAGELRRKCRKDSRTIGFSKSEFISIVDPVTSEAIFFCSKKLPGFIQANDHFLKDSIAMLWQKSIVTTASPGWYPKPSKGFLDTQLRGGPDAMREAAYRMGIKLKDLRGDAMDSRIDASSVVLDSLKSDEFISSIRG